MIRASDSTSYRERMNSCGKVENVVGGTSSEKHARKEFNVARNSKCEAVEELTVMKNYD